jgi:hypothetical protein
MSKPSIQTVLDRYNIRPNRAGFICCPVHDEDTPSCKMHDDWWYCHGCGANGDSIGLIAAITKRPVGDVLRDFAETTPSWRRASARTADLDPKAMADRALRAYRALHNWFFDEIRKRMEEAPLWLLERTVDYWSEVFDDARQHLGEIEKGGAPRSDEGPLLQGLKAVLEHGLDLETADAERVKP